MPTKIIEIKRREELARIAIRSSFGSKNAEYGSSLFVSHHLAELDASYWLKYLGTEKPEPYEILNILELQSCWDDEEDDLDTFDFTLPGEVKNYLLCVRFNESGEVDDVSMES